VKKFLREKATNGLPIADDMIPFAGNNM